MESVFESLDKQKEKIWSIWVGKYHNMGGDFCEIWPTYRTLEDETGISKNTIKIFIADCRKIGIAYCSSIVNGEECLFRGKGNFVYSKFQKETYREALNLAVNNG